MQFQPGVFGLLVIDKIMNPVIKEHLVSAVQTFLAVFLVTAGTGLESGHIAWTTSFFSSLALTAGRAGVKEVFARFMPPALGGRS